MPAMELDPDTWEAFRQSMACKIIEEEMTTACTRSAEIVADGEYESAEKAATELAFHRGWREGVKAFFIALEGKCNAEA